MAAFAACYKIDQCRESLPIPADITPSAFFLAAPAAPYIAAGVSVAMASFRACMTSGVCQRAVIAVGAIYTGKTVGDQAKDIWGNDDVDIWANYDAAKKAEDNNDIANDENNWYKNKNNEVKQSQQQKVSNTASNMPDPDDFDPEQFEPEKGKAKWEIKDPKEADKVMRHDKHGKFYRDPKQKYGNKEIWWTTDTAKHQGKYQGEFRESHYKLYIKKGKYMVRIADLNKYGNQLSKNMKIYVL